MTRTDAAPLDAVIARLRPAGDDRLVAFAGLYLRTLASGAAVDAEELAAEISSVHDFITLRTREVDVRVFNPRPEEHGYETAGTVIDIVAPDGPFLVDSVTNEIGAYGLRVSRVLHPVIGAERDAEGHLLRLVHPRHAVTKESVQHYELDRRLFEADLPALEAALRSILIAVRRVTQDFEPMLGRIDRMIEVARSAEPHVPPGDVEEVAAFLRWLCDDNFVFLGYREYEVTHPAGGSKVRAVSDTGLGILRDAASSSVAEPVPLRDLPSDVAERYAGGDLVMITKTNRLSPVHRRVRMDYVGIRRMDGEGRTIGEARLLGLFTSKAYMERSALTPILRRKLSDIVAAEDLIEGSHNHKALVTLFEGFSKHDLFASTTQDLRRTLVGMMTDQAHDRVRLYARRDLLERNVSLLVTMPRDRFSTSVRERLHELFTERLGGDAVDYHLALGESDPAQLHFTVWTGSAVPEIDYEGLEREVRQITRSWVEQLTEELAQRVAPGEALHLASDWAPRFPDYYAASTDVAVAAGDILRLAALAGGERVFAVGIQTEQPVEGRETLTRVALYRKDGKLPLSALVPALEDLGLQVVEEEATRMVRPVGYFIHDFGVLGPDGGVLDLERIGPLVEATLEAVWAGEAESDDLNRLITAAGLTLAQVEVLRAYRTYWRRVAPVFTVGYVNDTLVGHPSMAADLVRLFESAFDPGMEGADVAAAEAAILQGLDEIPSIEQDRILRTFLHLIQATLRTNAFGPDRRCLAFKFRSADVPDAPLPHPMVEIFVYGGDVEGIHLRGGMLARGGIRWSTRREDYRTEVLGLMKAQMTKNSVIVPTGAKGGFVLRRPPAAPAELAAEVERCYLVFIGALLDLTDDFSGGAATRPLGVRARDGDDPYLVVAADKGTATFSDAANALARERGFWLGDAFASGGSSGYDHKSLGITARSAWESLRRHFWTLGLDPDQADFTAVGIGDMSGDVFGNGMLLSDRIHLIAAFDHRDVFIDPDPDPVRAHAERARLFALPRSCWADYDPTAISEGGGVFSRSAKRITLSPQARAALGTQAEEITPTELVAIVLRAPVDLLWNGGIGTYVKAGSETHEDAGDRANDPVRADAAAVRARVIVEGGNLGLTQPGRVEYALSGGQVFTDFIDNSGGVNCSDREVNLKVMLALAVERGELDAAERDALISSVSDDVVARILRASFLQARMLAIEESASDGRLDAYEELMEALEDSGLLDRSIEALPGRDEITERARAGLGLAAPELAVLLAYEKRRLRGIVAGSPLADDPYVAADLHAYFPDRVVERFGHLIPHHPLRRELTAMLVANDVVDTLGVAFVSRLTARTGAEPADVVAAYLVARDVTGAAARLREIDGLLGTIDVATWLTLTAGVERLVTGIAAWYLRRRRDSSIAEQVAAGRAAFAEIEGASAHCGGEEWRAARRVLYDDLIWRGIPHGPACFHAAAPVLVSAPDLMEVADATGLSHGEVLDVALHAGQAFGIDRIAEMVAAAPAATRWDRWALWTVEEDLLSLRRLAAERVLEARPGGDGAAAVAAYLAAHPGLASRLERFLETLEAAEGGVAALTVAVRQVGAALA